MRIILKKSISLILYTCYIYAANKFGAIEINWGTFAIRLKILQKKIKFHWRPEIVNRNEFKESILIENSFLPYPGITIVIFEF